MARERILVTGGTGLVGSQLVHRLLDAGHEVSVLSRSERSDDRIRFYEWDVRAGRMDPDAVRTADRIVHLAGAGIADGRWTEERKRILRSSRLDSFALIQEVLADGDHSVKSVVSASAVGYYGDAGPDILDETAASGDDFAAQLCSDWEAMLDEVPASIRTARLRIGIVLSADGGALPKLTMTWPAGLSYFGDGSQYQSWIHIDDLAGLFEHALFTDTVVGPLNAVAPNPVTQKEMVRAIRRVKGFPTPVLPTPAPFIRLAMGEMANILLFSQRCSADRVLESGYSFRYEEIEPALEDLIG